MNITSYYLDYKTYFNFKGSCSSINKILDQNYYTLINQYKSVIMEKNRISNLKNFDPIYGFEINSDNEEIEKLLKEYLVNHKIPGVNLKNCLGEDMRFIECDVIKPLGITLPKSQIDKDRKSIFSSYD